MAIVGVFFVCWRVVCNILVLIMELVVRLKRGLVRIFVSEVVIKVVIMFICRGCMLGKFYLMVG